MAAGAPAVDDRRRLGRRHAEWRRPVGLPNPPGCAGEPLLHVATLAGDAEPVLLFGPEGGIDSDEREALLRAGWHPARLADTTLRFETAGVAAAAVLRAVQLSRG